ncbi:MAG: hypothetical protein JNL79_32860 [Myxococcales bacterium]|nr:hypothetical protein [Myxococcales bacterium]
MASAFDEARLALYAASPADFVARRKELSAALKGAGDPGGARLLGAMPKPNAPAWAVNHLYRAGALAKVMQAGHDNRRAQGNMAAGKLDAKGAREAQDAHRAALAEAGKLARQALSDAGLGGTDAVEAKVVALLQAISLRGSFAPYPEGCLAGEVESPSLDEMLDGLVDAPPAPVAPAPAPVKAAAPPKVVEDPAVLAARAAEARAKEAAEQERRRRDAERAAARAIVEQTEGRLRDARDAHAVARHRHERTRAAVAEAEAVLAKARDAAAHAEAQLRATEGVVEGAEREVGAAQAALTALG